MKVELFITKYNKIYDMSNTVQNITIETSMYDQAGKCTFALLDTGAYPRGSLVSLKVDGKGTFKGYIFKASTNEEGETEITAYDQMRYLKNTDTIYYSGKSASDIFIDICKKNDLKHKVVNKATYINLPYLYDKKTMFEILKTAIDENLRNTGNRYIVRDEYGTLKFRNIANLKTDLIIGDNSICTGFNYGRSIDDNTYNVIKLYRDNKDTKKRDIWQAQDSTTIKKWGKLKMTETVDEKATESQIKQLAKNMLRVLNRETKTLDLNIIGFYNLRAGDGVKVEIPMVDEWFYIKSISTEFENNHAESKIELFIP